MATTHFDPAAAPLVHGTARRALHWATAAGVLAAFAFVLSRELVDDVSLDRVLLDLHRGVGLIVLSLTLARFVHRFAAPMPARDDDARLRLAAGAAHGVLLVLLVALPVLGWAATNAGGHPVVLLGTIRLPLLVGRDRDLAEVLGDVHAAGAWILAGVVALHAAAALWHQFVRRDGTLFAMLPFGRLAPRSDG